MLSQPFILQLPRELCDQLLEEYQLSRKDIGSLRRTCKAFATIAGPILLCERVILSRLEEDRAKFKNVVKYHGRHVREVIWQGLNLDFWLLNPVYLEDEAHSTILAASVLQDTNLLWVPPQNYPDPTIGKIWQAASVLPDSSLLWVPPQNHPDPTIGKIWQAATNWISKQIDNMPNMTTLTIKLMPDNRAFGSGFKEVPMSWTQPRVYGISDFDFVVALMALGRPGCRVRTLNLDTRFGKWNILQVPMQDTDAFQYLTTINICFGPVKRWKYRGSHPLLTCIERSENLRNLKLCFEDGLGTGLNGPDLLLHGLKYLGGWPRLRSLHINAPLWLERYSGYLSGLRHLTLDDCAVTADMLDCFRRNEYHTLLESITIRARPTNSARFTTHLISSATVLAFIKREVEELGPGDTYKTPRELITDTTMPQCHLCSLPEKIE
ncbi:hypothetical protein EV127DRAFT_473496 [Xylaria flabelliformis]|nr:hypothetical protein EV127DRAFT_473496 [Xylaria flabelliformis]